LEWERVPSRQVRGFRGSKHARPVRGILSPSLSKNPGNIQHPTTNTQHPKTAPTEAIGCLTLDV
jgi:hypothetical protein